MTMERLENRQIHFLSIRKTRCIDDIYIEAEVYVDSIMIELGVEEITQVDSVKRPYRPNIAPLDSSQLEAVPLEPLFESLDSIEE